MYNETSIYGSLPKEMEDECCSLCEGKTIEQLRQMSDYFSRKASDMSEQLNKTVTVEDFDNMMKGKDQLDEGE